jgi:hypothetical protein
VIKINHFNDYLFKYQEQIQNLRDETSKTCEDSRYILGKYADMRWDILVQVWQQKDNRGRGLKTELIIMDELIEIYKKI